jgi:hypothetical protein
MAPRETGDSLNDWWFDFKGNSTCINLIDYSRKFRADEFVRVVLRHRGESSHTIEGPLDAAVLLDHLLMKRADAGDREPHVGNPDLLAMSPNATDQTRDGLRRLVCFIDADDEEAPVCRTPAAPIDFKNLLQGCEVPARLKVFRSVLRFDFDARFSEANVDAELELELAATFVGQVDDGIEDGPCNVLGGVQFDVRYYDSRSQSLLAIMSRARASNDDLPIPIGP